MIELGVIDLSAEGRRGVAALIEKWSWGSPDNRVSVPQISVSLLSPEEVRFNGSLDAYVIGPDLIGCDAAFVSTLRQQLPEKVLLCVLDSRSYSFSVVEQLGRLGVDDVLMDSATSDEFFRRLVLLQRRMSSKKRGVVTIVSGARGGVGVTFVAASVGEGLIDSGRRVCLVDCDVTSQDLTRFLGVSPYVNEPLRVLLDQQRVVTSESVLECVRSVWSDEPLLHCVSPAAGGDEALYGHAKVARAFLSVLESLALHFDEVIVDSSTLPASTLGVLYQAAERAIFVANRDPSGAYANRQALAVISGYLRPGVPLDVVVNDNSCATAPLSLLMRDVFIAPGRSGRRIVIPRSVRATRWPCGGYTPYQFLTRPIDQLLAPREGALSSSDRSLLDRVTALLREGLVARWMKGCFKWMRRKSSLRERGSVSSELEGGRAYPILIGSALPSVGEGQLVSKPMLVS